LGDRLTQALIGYHAFTGCDSVSAFSGREKVAPLKLLRKNEELMEAFIELGQSWTASESLISKLEEFTCRMYAASSKTDKVNTLHHELFLLKQGDVDSSMLPPV